MGQRIFQRKDFFKKASPSEEPSLISPPLTYGIPPSLAAAQRDTQACRAVRPGLDPWVGKIPCRRERLPTPVFWPGEFHGLYIIVHVVTKCGTRLSDFHFHFHDHWDVCVFFDYGFLRVYAQ